MSMAGRGFSGSYRFGYQGSEKDNEISGDGNSYTTEFRQLDPSLGRWFSVDPVFQPWQSPYTSMDNNPIGLTDKRGNITDPKTKKTQRAEQSKLSEETGDKRIYIKRPRFIRRWINSLRGDNYINNAYHYARSHNISDDNVSFYIDAKTGKKYGRVTWVVEPTMGEKVDQTFKIGLNNIKYATEEGVMLESGVFWRYEKKLCQELFFEGGSENNKKPSIARRIMAFLNGLIGNGGLHLTSNNHDAKGFTQGEKDRKGDISNQSVNIDDFLNLMNMTRGDAGTKKGANFLGKLSEDAAKGFDGAEFMLQNMTVTTTVLESSKNAADIYHMINNSGTTLYDINTSSDTIYMANEAGSGKYAPGDTMSKSIYSSNGVLINTTNYRSR